jgi:K+-transporting ATPase ATPase B chain
VKFRAVGAGQVLRTNMLIYGVGGIALPFVGIKIIDVLLVAMKLA